MKVSNRDRAANPVAGRKMKGHSTAISHNIPMLELYWKE